MISPRMYDSVKRFEPTFNDVAAAATVSACAKRAMATGTANRFLDHMSFPIRDSPLDRKARAQAQRDRSIRLDPGIANHLCPPLEIGLRQLLEISRGSASRLQSLLHQRVD